MAFKLRVKNLVITNKGVPLAGPELRTKKVQIVAPSTNVGAVYYGSKGMTAGIWRVLAAGATDTHEAPDKGELDLSALRFDAANNNDKVTLLYYEWEEQAETAYLLPSQVNNLWSWWKADAITGLSNNQEVSSFPDSSGNSRALEPSGDGPLYQQNIQNGLPGVLYDGDAQNLNLYLPSNSPTAMTVLLAVDLTVCNLLWQFEGFEDTNHTLYGLATGKSIFTVVIDAAGGELRRNGERISAGFVAGSAQAGSFWICGYDGQDACAGYLFEGVTYNAALSESQIELLEAGLNDKWLLY